LNIALKHLITYVLTYFIIANAASELLKTCSVESPYISISVCCNQCFSLKILLFISQIII